MRMYHKNRFAGIRNKRYIKKMPFAGNAKGGEEKWQGRNDRWNYIDKEKP